jgi:hypothetical protein
MTLKTLIIFFNWAVNAGVFFGVTLNISNIEMSPMVGLIVSGAAEIIAYILLQV